MFRLMLAGVLLAVSPSVLAQDGGTAGASTPAAKPIEPLPTATFARLPFIENAELSPDGRHLAGLFAIKGEQRIGIIPIGGDASQSIFVGVPDLTEVDWLQWVGDDNIIVGLRALLPVETDNWYISRLISINRTTGKPTRLLWDLKGQDASSVVWVPTDGSTEILVAGQNSIYEGEDFWPAVYRVDVATGRKRTEVNARGSVLDWGADHLGRVRYGIGYRDNTTKSTLIYRGDGKSVFRSIDSASLRDEERLSIPFVFVPGTDNGLVYADAPDGRTVIAENDLSTGKQLRIAHEVPAADIEGAIRSPDGSRLIGFYTSDNAKPIQWIDPAMAAHQKELDAASPQSKVRIESYSRDLSKLLVRISTPDNPGLFYYYDATTNNLSKLASVNEAIGGKRLSRSRLVQYKARDGLEIEGVLTMPRGRAKENLPLIVMPHGGPWGHDTLSYDYWAQFLAERGYAVLQPNFRGSTGYGEKFLKAGQGQLGFAMQDDVTDGVRWAVAEKIADPKRVCIVGASYGGYAAMWGIAKDPDQYRCAVSINGVSNLRREVNDFGGKVHSRLYRDQWQKMTPDFAAVSPINAIDRIRTPLLLIHGKKDVTVDHVQSAKMYSAMTKAGKSVEFVSIPLADHYFTREADRTTLLTAIEAFLAKHNPAD
ncbi:S9 family peptidase [Sphingopyxis sp. KK2]|uniref:alpha/beta hydrolase family protein n=1 Tax=Sphingopyxis sp. KK2 TaxID=1855727 RepID=UPI00097E60AF|nr:S9 family peptidase [Sphingopyxis sp. KK2]